MRKPFKLFRYEKKSPHTEAQGPVNHRKYVITMFDVRCTMQLI
jgi:hypothetical protein